MKCLNIKSKLSNAYNNCPLYPKTIDDIKLADPMVIRILVALMNQHAAIGGAASHWGGPSAYAEIFSSLHAIFFSKPDWSNHFHFINDTGHAENAIYATRALYNYDNMTFETLKGFRSIESKLTGHGESHLNPEGVLISNGPLGSGLPQAQGLAIGDKLQKSKRVTICTLSDGAAMEGEAKESLSAIPGLAAKGILNPFLLIISDNDTKLSGRISEDAFSMTPTLDSLTTLGWNVQYVKNGNNLEEVYATISKAITNLESQQSLKPIAIICKTVKGYGIKSTSEAKSGGHGYPLKAYDSKLKDFLNELSDNQLPEEFKLWCDEILESKKENKKDSSENNQIKKEKVQLGVAQALIEKCKEGYPILSISSDLAGSTGVASFQKEFPNHTIDLGVAESNMISTAIGLSKSGYIPIVDTFSQFAITKGNLPLIMSSLSSGPIIGIFSHTGFQDAADGASHQATTYLSAVSSIPNTDVVVLSSSKDAYEFISRAIVNFKLAIEAGKTPKSTLFFLGRETYAPEIMANLKYDYHAPQVIQTGEDLVLVSCGPLIYEALEAAKYLKVRGINCTVVNQHFINKFKIDRYKELLKMNNFNLVTLEDHQVIGGMGSILIHQLKQNQLQFKSISFGINEQFGQSAYKSIQLYQKHQLDGENIAKKIYDCFF